MKRMWINGGGGAFMAVLVFGALLAAAHPQLGQLMQNDSTVSAKVFGCFARYMRTPQELPVLLVHTSRVDVTRYVASIRSSLLILNAGVLNNPKISVPASLKRILHTPRSLLVFLVATEEDVRVYDSLLVYEPQNTRYLAVCLEPRFGALTRKMLRIVSIYGRYQIAVLTAKNTHVYSRYPIGGALCHRPWYTKVQGQCQWLSLNQLYAHKKPVHHAGCYASIFMPYPAPCTLDKASLSEQPLVAGYELALANIVTRHLHLRKHTDSSILRSPCQSSYPYYTDTLRWYVPVAGPRAQWKSVVRVFQAPLWFTILAFFLLNTLAWWLVGGSGGYVKCVLDSLRTLLNGAVPLPLRTPFRFLVVSWTLCALVLVAAYQSQLLSTLLTPVSEQQPITNEKELLASDTPLDFSSIEPELKFLNGYKQIMAHARKFRADPNKPRAILQYGVTARYRAREQAGALVALEDPVKQVPLCVKLGTYYLVADAVNQVMRRLMENGIVAKFMREVDFSNYVGTGGGVDEPLTLGHLGFAFFALLLGCALATLTFLLEVVRWRMQHGWWRVLCTNVKQCRSRIQDCWRTCTTSVQRWRQRARIHRRWRFFRRRVLPQLNHQ